MSKRTAGLASWGDAALGPSHGIRWHVRFPYRSGRWDLQLPTLWTAPHGGIDALNYNGTVKFDRWPRYRWLLGIAAGAGCLALAIEVFPHAKDLATIPKWGKVDERLYRSGRLSSLFAEATLQQHRIGRIVSLGALDTNDDRARWELETCRKLQIEHVTCAMPGNGIAPVESYVEAVSLITGAVRDERPVLVHCSAGSQRTGAVVALYRLMVLHDSPSAVREELLAYGHVPARNPELIPHLNRSMAQVAASLVTRGVISAVPNPMPQLAWAD